MTEVVGDCFVIGDERSKLKAPAPDRGPFFGVVLSPMDDVVVDGEGGEKIASVDSGAEGHRERKGRSMLLFQRERHIACEEKAHNLDD